MSGGWQCLKCGAAPSGPGQFCAGCGADLRATAISVPSGMQMPTPVQQQPARSSGGSGVAATLGCVVLGIGGIGTAGLVAMVAIWFVLSDVASLPMPLSGPRYTFDDMAVTDACSGIFDYCVRATCLVRNVGTSDGTATVLFDLDPHTTQPSQATETVIVPVGTARAVSHDFPEAGAFSDHNVECHFR